MQRERSILISARDDLRKSAAEGLTIDDWRKKWDGNTLVTAMNASQQEHPSQDIVIENKSRPNSNDVDLLQQVATPMCMCLAVCMSVCLSICMNALN